MRVEEINVKKSIKETENLIFFFFQCKIEFYFTHELLFSLVATTLVKILLLVFIRYVTSENTSFWRSWVKWNLILLLKKKKNIYIYKISSISHLQNLGDRVKYNSYNTYHYIIHYTVTKITPLCSTLLCMPEMVHEWVVHLVVSIRNYSILFYSIPYFQVIISNHIRWVERNNNKKKHEREI